jgi:hypothetical protein
VVGPIEWEPGPAPGAIRVDIDGRTRMATAGDERSIARALGAETWLEAAKNASAEPHCAEIGCSAGPTWWQGSDDRDRYSLWCDEHVPALEPGESRHRIAADAPAPRRRVNSNALLDDAGDPVSASDLDSGEISDDPDPDERTTERVAEVEP